ncbi:MAG TPA: contractile injection system tape measure protein, partial [Kofleriaceae bacterium]
DAHLRLLDASSDEAYVENAGVVLLWPFLRTLFERLELTADRRFEDAAAQGRAAGLLQHLVTGELEPLEHELALAKVLCGLAPAELIELDPPVTDVEADECTQLLTAAIANAPILGDLSIAGFRGSFLIRNGVLGTRDGVWWLRVERAPYDVVLDQLPWSVSWVRLPWMETPLAVEW